MGPSVSLRGASPRQRPVAAGGEGSALERPEGANGRLWADSGRAPVRAPISAHLLARPKTARDSVQGEIRVENQLKEWWGSSAGRRAVRGNTDRRLGVPRSR